MPQSARPALYATFWQMSSYNIYFSKDKYIEAEKSLDNNARAANKKYGDADRSSDRSVRATTVNHRNQRDRYQNAVTELRKERVAQELVHKFTTDKGGMLDKEKKQWLSHGMLLACEACKILTYLRSRTRKSCQDTDVRTSIRRALCTSSLSIVVYGRRLLCSPRQVTTRVGDVWLACTYVL